MPVRLQISWARAQAVTLRSSFLNGVWIYCDVEYRICYCLDCYSYFRLLRTAAVVYDEEYFITCARTCFFTGFSLDTDSQVPDPPLAVYLEEDAEATTG